MAFQAFAYEVTNCALNGRVGRYPVTTCDRPDRDERQLITLCDEWLLGQAFDITLCDLKQYPTPIGFFLNRMTPFKLHCQIVMATDIGTKHDEAKRKIIPSVERQTFVKQQQAAPKQIWHPCNQDRNPQLVRILGAKAPPSYASKPAHNSLGNHVGRTRSLVKGFQ